LSAKLTLKNHSFGWLELSEKESEKEVPL